MASDALFQMLAQAKAQPSRGYRTFENALGAVEAPIQGYRQAQAAQIAAQEARLKPFEIWTKISDSAGPDVANSIFKQRGIPIPDMGGDTAGTPRTPEQLARMGGGWAGKQLANQNTLDEMKKRDLDIQNNQPFPGDVASAIGKGDIESLVRIHAAKNEPVPFREMNAAISAKRPNMMGGYFQTKEGTAQLGQLPSQLPSGTIPGSAALVKMAARQGKSLIAKATTPQNLKLASVDLTRAVSRMAPDAATIGESNYGSSLPTLVGKLTQTITADPNSPDVPKLRKQIYDTLDELDKSATPFLINHLQNMEANGTNSTFGNNWGATKNRELGLNIPEIPFDPGTGSAQNPNVDNGIPQIGGTFNGGKVLHVEKL